jgi:carbon-monoxide dehydrogenase medium subunit
MTLQGVRYHRPSTLRDACLLGRHLGEKGAFLAGGTELIPDNLNGRDTTAELISLGALTELRGIAVDGDTLRIGSLTTIAELTRSPVVKEWLPALSEAALALGSPQIRSRATVGGNFCRAVSCADLPPAVLIANARLRIASPDTTREIAAEDFFVGARRTVLTPGELLVEVRIPRPPAHTGTSFERFGLRNGLAIAVASVAARIQWSDGYIKDAAVALGAVAPTPMLVDEIPAFLRGNPPSPELFERAAALCVAASKPISDIRGTADFRRRITAVLAHRALDRATERATVEGLLS